MTATAQPGPVDLAVDIRDLARVPPIVMHEAKTELEAMFRATGVRVIWTADASPGRIPPIKLFVVGSVSSTAHHEEEPRVATLGLAPLSGHWAQVF